MLQKGTGVIVNFSSGSGRSTGSLKSCYSASKFAVEALSKCIAADLPEGLCCVPLAPGTICTELNPDEGSPQPEAWAPAAADFILGLGSDPAHNGASLSVPGFYSESYLSKWIIPDGQPLIPEGN